MLIDIVFSFDFIILVIGMIGDIFEEVYGNFLVIIYVVVIIFMIIMLLVLGFISCFINNCLMIKMIVFGFLVIIGVILMVEVFGEEILKGYIYFVMVYVLLIEFLNIKVCKNCGEFE